MTYKCVYARLHSTVDETNVCFYGINAYWMREFRSKEQINVSHITLCTYI